MSDGVTMSNFQGFGGGSGSQNLQQVTDVGNVTIRPISIEAILITGIVKVSAAAYSPDEFVHTMMVDISGNDVTITLPTAASYIGQRYIIKIENIDVLYAYKLTIQSTAINGSIQPIVFSYNGESVELFCEAPGSWVTTNPYKRDITFFYARAAFTGGLLMIPHGMHISPQNASVFAANTAAAGVLAGGSHILLDAVNVNLFFAIPPGVPTDLQFYVTTIGGLR